MGAKQSDKPIAQPWSRSRSEIAAPFDVTPDAGIPSFSDADGRWIISVLRGPFAAAIFLEDGGSPPA
jgi:hypothetical protein